MSLGSALAPLVAAALALASSTALASTSDSADASTKAATMAAAGAPHAGRDSRGTGWTWPLDPEPEVAARFDPPVERWNSGHRGVDLAAVVGQSVLAPAAGRITFAGMIAGRGVVVVAHEGGLRSTFEPVRGSVGVGESVGAGQQVAVLDETAGHCAPETCLHWGVLRGDTYLDPLSFLTRRPIVLLPLH